MNSQEYRKDIVFERLYLTDIQTYLISRGEVPRSEASLACRQAGMSENIMSFPEPPLFMNNPVQVILGFLWGGQPVFIESQQVVKNLYLCIR